MCIPLTKKKNNKTLKLKMLCFLLTMVTNFKYCMEAFILKYKLEETLTYVLFFRPRKLFWSFPFRVLLLTCVQPVLKLLKYSNHQQTSNRL